MNCTEFKASWSQWHAGETATTQSQRLWQHAQDCPSCALHHRQMQSMLRALNALPAPGRIPDDLGNTLFTKARKLNAGRPRITSSPTWAGLGLAAGVVAATIGALLIGLSQSNPGSLPIQPGKTVVRLELNQQQNVHVIFDAEQAIDEVEYTIELPDGVELVGYAGLQVLHWQGRLQAGRNGLTLPLVSRKAGLDGSLKAAVRYQDIEQELQLPLQTPGSSGLPQAQTPTPAGGHSITPNYAWQNFTGRPVCIASWA